MTWCNESSSSDHDQDHRSGIELIVSSTVIPTNDTSLVTKPTQVPTLTCPSCGHQLQLQGEFIKELSGLPAGVKFDPNDEEILKHLEAKVMFDVPKLHPLIDDFIPTLQAQNGICCTHPQKLPGVKKDGHVRHFFHRPSKAYTTGTRKRRKVDTDEEGSETRWHKTGKTRPIFIHGVMKGFKKILVLYTNYGRQKKPEKTNWVMHQYHLGSNEEEKDGELVVSKVFYQTQPRQCGGGDSISNSNIIIKDTYENLEASHHDPMDYYNSHFMNYEHVGHDLDSSVPQVLIPNMDMQGDDDSFIPLTMDVNQARFERN